MLENGLSPDTVLQLAANFRTRLDAAGHVIVGCRLVMGLTYDVLTRGFYDRLGYRTVGMIENCPAGTATRWYCKDL